MKAAIGIGGNLGDALATCQAAVEALSQEEGVTVTALSPFYRCEPWGDDRAQPWFVNAVALVWCTLPGEALLTRLHALEARFGRLRDERRPLGPRTLDLDLLYMGDLCIDTPGFSLPHPRLHLRRFVLEPLAALDGGWVHPRFAKTVDRMLADVDDRARLEPLASGSDPWLAPGGDR